MPVSRRNGGVLTDAASDVGHFDILGLSRLPVRVWGWADADAEVKVTFAGQTQTAKADKQGKWSLKLEPLNLVLLWAE